MQQRQSKYERMRTDPTNWKLGIVYYCPTDPRLVVRQLLPVGWTWNFAHPVVYLVILAAVAVFLAPLVAAWGLGLRSLVGLGLIAFASLIVVMIVANRLARDPEQ